MGEKAIRLRPQAPLYYFANLSTAYYWVERYQENLHLAEKLINEGKKPGAERYQRWGYWHSARAKVKLGRESEAKADFAKFLEFAPDFTWEKDRKYSLYKPEIIEKEHEDMRNSRIPGHPSSQ